VKIIGVEIRVGTVGGQHARIFEAKLVPLEIEFPPELTKGHGSAGHPIVTMTIHTSDGDTNVQAYLPTRGDWTDARQITDAQFVEAMRELERRVKRT